MSVNVDVPGDARLGPCDIIIRNGDEGVLVAKNVFSVIEPGVNPQITSIEPPALGQGAGTLDGEIDVVIKGRNIHGTDGEPFVGTVDFGADITVTSQIYDDILDNLVDELRLKLIVAADAVVGGRTLTVTNPSPDTGSGTANFTVNAAPTNITSKDSIPRDIGQTATILGTGFVPSDVATLAVRLVTPDANIVIGAATYVSSTELTITIDVLPDATTGPRDVYVINGDAGVGEGTITIQSLPLIVTVTGVEPSSRGQDAEAQEIVITGTDFYDDAEVTIGGPDDGITVASAEVDATTQITAIINVASDATLDAHDVVVTNTDGGTGTGEGLFTVNHAPVVSGVDPNNRGQGFVGEVSILGAYFQGTTAGEPFEGTVDFSGTGIVEGSITYVSDTKLTVQLDLTEAEVGPSTVTVTNPDAGVDISDADAFTVNAAPVVTSVSPTAVARGADVVTTDIIISGSNFYGGIGTVGEEESSVVFSGEGIDVTDVSVNDTNDDLTVTIQIAPDAVIGLRDVTVINPDGGQATLQGTQETGFEILAMVSSVTPDNRGQGASNQSITIEGNGFQDGASVSLGADIIVGDVVISEDGTTITATISVDGDAEVGTRDVTVTNLNLSPSVGEALFTVNAGPKITEITPNFGLLGTTVDVTIAGTGFVADTDVSFSYGVTVNNNNVTFVSDTEILVKISIVAEVEEPNSDVTVTNPDAGTMTLPDGFVLDNEPPVVAEPEATPDPVEVGGELTISAVVTDNVEVDTVALRVKTGGKVTPEMPVPMSGDGDSWTVTITVGNIRGIAYFLVATDTAGNTKETNLYPVTVTGSLESPVEYQLEKWHQISFPLMGDGAFPDDWGTWFAYTYDKSAEDFKLVSALPNPRKGAFIKLYTADSQILTIEGQTADITKDTEINLKLGWNLIGLPFSFNRYFNDDTVKVKVDGSDPVSITVANEKGWVYDKIYRYDPNTEDYSIATPGSQQMLEPFAGYWVLAYQTATLLISPTVFGPDDEPVVPSAAPSARVSELPVVAGIQPPSLPVIMTIPGVALGENGVGQNYPNPFNPDTWIPYQLKEDSDVTIDIYNLTGQLVRTLKLGHKSAGLYVTKERALHWDGRNNVSDRVASGIYFYQLRTATFTSPVYKMVILK